MKRLRLLQVGLGNWGRNWTRSVVLPSDEVELVAVVDLMPESLQRLRAETEFPAERCYATLESALAAREIDAVLITASLPGHAPLAQAALEADKHVLIEKPFAASLAEGRRLVAAAAARDRLLMVSQNYRFYPAVQAVRQLLRERRLGALTSVDIAFRRYDNPDRDGYRHFGIRQPLLLDMSIHHFDLLRYTLEQEPARVACHAWNPPWSRYREPAAARAIIEMAGGAVVNYAGSWTSTAPATPWGGRWRLGCEQGEISWTTRGDRATGADRVVLRPFRTRSSTWPLPPLPRIDRAGVLSAFVAAVRSGIEPESSGRDNLGSLALTFAAIAAAETGEAQELSAAPR